MRKKLLSFASRLAAPMTGLVSLGAALVAGAGKALAVAGLPDATADSVATRLVNVVKEILMPLGALVIFVAVAWTAFQLIFSADKPEQRGRVMSSLPYVLGGGLLLGGTMLVAGFIVGLMQKVGQ